MRSIQVFFAPAPRLLSSREVINGVSVSETIPLARIEITIVSENSRKIRPMSPLMNTSGIKTAANESVMARIVKLISLAEFSDASKALCPVSIRRTVFSRNTIASSTRNPMARVKAINERLSRL